MLVSTFFKFHVRRIIRFNFMVHTTKWQTLRYIHTLRGNYDNAHKSLIFWKHLKSSGYYLHSKWILNNSTFCPHCEFMSFVWIWEQTAIISPYSINWLVFITEKESVYCAVRPGALYIYIYIRFNVVQNVFERKLNGSYYRVTALSLFQSLFLLSQTKHVWQQVNKPTLSFRFHFMYFSQ